MFERMNLRDIESYQSWRLDVAIMMVEKVSRVF